MVERRVLKADPGYRRRVLIRYGLFWALFVGLLLATYHWGPPAFFQYIERQQVAEAMRLLEVVMKGSVLFSAALAVALSAYAFRIGWRVRTSGQLPAPGTRVLWDTPIVEGPVAVRSGMVTMVGSVVLALVFVSVAVAFLLLYDFSRLWPARAR